MRLFLLGFAVLCIATLAPRATAASMDASDSPTPTSSSQSGVGASGPSQSTTSETPTRTATIDDTVEELIVTGQRRKRRPVTTAEAMFRLTYNGGMARWERDICLSVTGTDRETAQAVAHRMNDLAQRVGRTVKLANNKECFKRNAQVIFGHNFSEILMYDEVSSRLNRKQDTRFLTGQLSYGTRQAIPDDEYKAWATSWQPIKYWYNFGQKRVEEKPGAEFRMTTRLRSLKTPEQIVSAIAYVDELRLGNVDRDAVFDHIAFVMLTGVEAYPATMKQNSILALFPRGQEPRNDMRVSEFDLAYLHEFYKLDFSKTTGSQGHRLLISRRLCKFEDFCD